MNANASAALVPPLAQTRSGVSRIARAAAVIAVLVLVALLRSMAGTAHDSLTIDEPYHYASGVAYQRYGDYRLNPEHPPLVKRWVAMLAPSSVVMPPLRPLHEKRDERRYVQTMAYLDNRPEVTQANIRRGMFALDLLLIAGLAGVVWRLAGGWWAVGTAAFLAVEPTVGAHLPLLMTDLPVSLALGLAAAVGAWFAGSWRWSGALGFGLAAGVALACKHSAVAGVAGIGLALVVYAMLRRRQGDPSRLARLGRIAASAVVAVAFLWATYGFQFHAARDGSDPFNRPIEAKIDDLTSPFHRGLLHAVDTAHLLPRAYVWGMADTIRAGVEGRGQKTHLLYGHKFKGAPPWFFWPATIASKVPLPLLFAALAGLAALWRAPLSASQKRLLAITGAMALAHWIALLDSRGTYAGVRHALPIVVALAVLAGTLTWRLSTLRKPAWAAAGLAPAALALAMTAREPRLYEYFNETAGGSANAWRNFANEGIDLGQRLYDVRDYARAHKPASTPIYNMYYYMPEWERGTNTPFRRFANGIDDTNVAGRFDGWFLMPLSMTIPEPEYDYDPSKVLANVKLIHRIGTLGIWSGRMDDPRLRASNLYAEILSYVYENPRPDWRKVADRCGEILAVAPFQVGCAVERGNALARLGDVTGARAAWAQARANLAPDDPTSASLLALDRSIRDGKLPANWTPVRNPWME